MSVGPVQDQCEHIRRLIAQQHRQLRDLAKTGEDLLAAQAKLEQLLGRSSVTTQPEGIVPAWVAAKAHADVSHANQPPPNSDMRSEVMARAIQEMAPPPAPARATSCSEHPTAAVYRSGGKLRCAMCERAW